MQAITEFFIAIICVFGGMILFLLYDILAARVRMWREKKLIEELLRNATAKGLTLYQFGGKILLVNLNIANAMRKIEKLKQAVPSIRDFFKSSDYLDITHYQTSGDYERGIR